MKVDVLNINGSSAGRSVDLPDEIFAVEPNKHAMYLAVKAYQAHQRQGTHKSKEKGEITGSTRKLKKQKGTGTARFGSIKNGVFRGGGRFFGPKPRTYTVRLNKKVKRLARASALSQKLGAGEIKIVEDFTFDQPKTKEMLNVLNNLQLTDAKSMIVLGDYDKNLHLSARNIPKTGLVYAGDLNIFQIMNGGTLLIAESAVSKLKETFKV